MKIVLDTNVYISAFLFRGVPYSVYEICLEQYEVFSSRFIVDEVLEKFSL